MKFSDRVQLIRKYAEAFYTTYQQEESAALSQPFVDAASTLKDSPAALVLLSHLQDQKRFEQCARQFIAECQLPISLLRLLKLLRVHNRVMLFADVCAYIGELIDKAENIERVQLLCTPLLRPEQEAVVAHYLAKKCGRKKIVFSAEVDDSLIAGVRVIGKNWIWERSIGKKLRALDALCAQHAA